MQQNAVGFCGRCLTLAAFLLRQKVGRWIFPDAALSPADSYLCATKPEIKISIIWTASLCEGSPYMFGLCS